MKRQCCLKIIKQYKTYKFRKNIKANLKKLKKTITILKKYSNKNKLEVIKQVF